MGLKLIGKNTRLLLEDDVIKAVDKHTNEDGTLDNDISCILEEVKSVVIAGSKEAMSKSVANEPKYDFHVGDFVEDINGNIGYIDFICDCDRCKECRFNEPRIRYTSGETDYITVYQLEHLDKSYRRIGKYEFTKKAPIVKSVDSITVTGTTDEDKPFTMTFSDFDNDKVEIESVNDNGKKTLSLIIHDGYSMKVEYRKQF